MLKKMIISGIAIAFLILIAGCAARINEVMKSWEGHHISDLIASWGPPQQIMDDGRGNKIYIYSSTRTIVSPGYSTTNVYGSYGYATGTSVYYPPTSSSYNAFRMFWVNEGGYIFKWSWRGL